MSSGGAAPLSERPILILLLAFLVCFAAWAAGGLLTRPNLDWYATLAKPDFTPPNRAFPIVWSILYAMMAVSAWLVWLAEGSQAERRRALTWFGIQLVIGVVWSFAFFWLHNPLLGLIVIVALVAAIAVTIVLFDRLSRTAALLLIPYLLWVCFAAALNSAIWLLNPAQG